MAAFAGRLFLLLAAVGAGSVSPVLAAQEAAGQWLLAGSAGASGFALIACPDGTRLAEAALPARLAAPPVLAAAGTSASAITEAGELLSFELPSLRRAGAKELPMQATQLAVSGPDGELLAAGGSGTTPLAVFDARSLLEVHVYRPDRETVISTIAHADERASFVVGLARPATPAEVWEIAHGADAPPVLKGLVHDYRMGEAIALPGRFTPRVAPVSSSTQALVAGARAGEWLRIGSDGAANVLHLEVRREIGRLPGTADDATRWLAAAWQSGSERGWVLGKRGGRSLQVLQAGADWRVSRVVGLPAPLLAMRGFGGHRAVVLALGGGRIALARFDAATSSLQDVREPPTAEYGSLRLPVRLERSRDGRCIALLDAADRWIAATLSR